MYVCVWWCVNVCTHVGVCVCARMHKDVSTKNKNSKRDAVSAGIDGIAVLWRDWNGPGPETN